MRHQELQALRQSADRGGALLLERARIDGAVRVDGAEALLRLQAGNARAIGGVELEQELVELIAQARGLRDHPLALGDQQAEHAGLVVRRDRG